MEDGILLADGFNDAKKCIEVLEKRDGMTQEEALEFFEFNVVGAWVGEQTPIFVCLGDIDREG